MWSPDGKHARLLFRPRRRRGALGARPGQRHRPPHCCRRHHRRRGRRTGRSSHISIPDRSCAWCRSLTASSGRYTGGCSSRASQLVARRPRGGDVGAARRIRRASARAPTRCCGWPCSPTRRPMGRRPSRPTAGWIRFRTSRSACARTSDPVWSPERARDGGHRRRPAHHVSRRARRHAHRPAPPRSPTDLASSPSWTGDSRRVLYQTADRLPPGRPRRRQHSRHRARSGRGRRRRQPATTTTIHAGRLFDGRAGTAAQADMDVVIEGSRIVAVAPHRDDQHRGTVVDASGRHGAARADREPRAPVESARRSAGPHLAVVRRHDRAQSRRPMPFEGQEEREAIEAGVRVGPRVITTGEPLDGSRIYYPGRRGARRRRADRRAAGARAARCASTSSRPTCACPTCCRSASSRARTGPGMPVTSHEIYPAVAYGADGVEHVRGTSRRGFSPKISELRPLVPATSCSCSRPRA